MIILFTGWPGLPSSETWILRTQVSTEGPNVITSQRYSPSSADVTVSKINVSLLGTQVALKRLLKPCTTDSACRLRKQVATGVMPNFIDTAIKRKSVVKLKLQFSSAFIEPLIRLLFAEEMLDGVVTVSITGESYHVMLPPSETKNMIHNAYLTTVIRSLNDSNNLNLAKFKPVVPKAVIEQIRMPLKNE